MGNFIFRRPIPAVFFRVLNFPDHGNGIVMAPVHRKVTVSRYGAVILIARRRA